MRESLRVCVRRDKGLEEDKLRQREEGIRAFWGIHSISAFTMLVHTHGDIVLRERNPFIEVDGESLFQLTLTPKEWSWDGKGYTRSQVAARLAFLQHNYTCNGSHVKR